MLLSLASECNGTYSFIPVAPNVGTVFVNTVSNVLSNFTQSATLKLAPSPGSTFAGPVGANLESSDEAWGKHIYLGPLQHGQSRDVVVPMAIPAGQSAYLEATLCYPHPVNGKEVKVVGVGETR